MFTTTITSHGFQDSQYYSIEGSSTHPNIFVHTIDQSLIASLKERIRNVLDEALSLENTGTCPMQFVDIAREKPIEDKYSKNESFYSQKTTEINVNPILNHQKQPKEANKEVGEPRETVYFRSIKVLKPSEAETISKENEYKRKTASLVLDEENSEGDFRKEEEPQFDFSPPFCAENPFKLNEKDVIDVDAIPEKKDKPPITLLSVSSNQNQGDISKIEGNLFPFPHQVQSLASSFLKENTKEYNHLFYEKMQPISEKQKKNVDFSFHVPIPTYLGKNSGFLNPNDLKIPKNSVPQKPSVTELV